MTIKRQLEELKETARQLEWQLEGLRKTIRQLEVIEVARSSSDIAQQTGQKATVKNKDTLLMSVEEVANTLGYSKLYTYQLIRNGEIASMKGKGKMGIVRVPTTALQEYIKAHTRKSNLELSEKATEKLNRG